MEKDFFTVSGDDPQLKNLVQVIHQHSKDLRLTEDGLIVSFSTSLEKALQNSLIEKNCTESLVTFFLSTIKNLPLSFLAESQEKSNYQNQPFLFTKTVFPVQSEDSDHLKTFSKEIKSILETCRTISKHFESVLPSLSKRFENLISLGEHLERPLIFFETTLERCLFFPAQWSSLNKILNSRIRESKISGLSESLKNFWTKHLLFQKQRNQFIKEFLNTSDPKAFSECLELLNTIESLQKDLQVFLGKENLFFQTFSICGKDGKKAFLASNYFNVLIDTIKKIMHRELACPDISLGQFLKQLEKTKEILSNMEEDLQKKLVEETFQMNHWIRLYKNFLIRNPLLFFLALGLINIMPDPNSKKILFYCDQHFFLSDWIQHFQTNRWLEQERQILWQTHLNVEEQKNPLS